jgi:ribA/ribD-fused uncharacterized protein
MQQHGHVLAYFGHLDFPSHMHAAGFWYRDLFFEHVEKFIMFGKAKTFQDEATAQRIMQTENPYQCKQIGKEVLGFNQVEWNEWRGRFALIGNREKYRQNPQLAQLLIQTHPFILAEATWNKDWGAGFAKDDARIGNVQGWTGANLGGNTVMRVREELMRGTLR